MTARGRGHFFSGSSCPRGPATRRTARAKRAGRRDGAAFWVNRGKRGGNSRTNARPGQPPGALVKKPVIKNCDE